MINQRRCRLVVIAIATMIVMGCTSNRVPYVNQTAKSAGAGMAGGGIVGPAGAAGAAFSLALSGAMGAVIGHTIDKQTPKEVVLARKIALTGTQIIPIGETTRIILDADRFFYSHSPRFNRRSGGILKMVAQYMQPMDRKQIRIEGYTMDNGQDARNLALSRQRAWVIKDQLLANGLTGKPMITTVGYGPEHLIYYPGEHESKNNRIEIVIEPLLS